MKRTIAQFITLRDFKATALLGQARKGNFFFFSSVYFPTPQVMGR